MLLVAPESLTLFGSVAAGVEHLTEGVARGHTISDPLVMPHASSVRPRQIIGMCDGLSNMGSCSRRLLAIVVDSAEDSSSEDTRHERANKTRPPAENPLLHIIAYTHLPGGRFYPSQRARTSADAETAILKFAKYLAEYLITQPQTSTLSLSTEGALSNEQIR
jgi:hypothetical protein